MTYRVWVGLLAALTITSGAPEAHRFVRRFAETSGLTVAIVGSL